MTENRQETIQWLGEQWNQFWLEPSAGQSLRLARQAVCVLACMWLLTFCFDASWWYGPTGWNETSFAKRLNLATDEAWPSRFRISPLWMTSKPLVFQLYAAGTGVLTIAAFFGLGGRLTIALLAGLILFLAQRSTWMTGAFEPFLIACLGYLIIDPGCSISRQTHSTSNPSRWSATLASRLIQVHTWLLILFGLAYLVANQCWWRGEGVWWLAATNQAWLFDSETLRGRILLVNACTHLVVLSAFITCAFYWIPRFQRLAVVSGLILASAYALLAGQTLYGGLLASMLLVTNWAPTSPANPPTAS